MGWKSDDLYFGVYEGEGGEVVIPEIIFKSFPDYRWRKQ